MPFGQPSTSAPVSAPYTTLPNEANYLVMPTASTSDDTAGFAPPAIAASTPGFSATEVLPGMMSQSQMAGLLSMGMGMGMGMGWLDGLGM